mmetsp:Transcript_4704/g.12435  ORF Transcript_4704/g.12435 Transcript_4704/m.12435 type:complete len:330 (-) Transcript_4704:155-1144(-)
MGPWAGSALAGSTRPSSTAVGSTATRSPTPPDLSIKAMAVRQRPLAGAHRGRKRRQRRRNTVGKTRRRCPCATVLPAAPPRRPTRRRQPRYPTLAALAARSHEALDKALAAGVLQHHIPQACLHRCRRALLETLCGLARRDDDLADVEVLDELGPLLQLGRVVVDKVDVGPQVLDVVEEVEAAHALAHLGVLHPLDRLHHVQPLMLRVHRLVVLQALNVLVAANVYIEVAELRRLLKKLDVPRVQQVEAAGHEDLLTHGADLLELFQLRVQRLLGVLRRLLHARHRILLFWRRVILGLLLDGSSLLGGLLEQPEAEGGIEHLILDQLRD